MTQPDIIQTILKDSNYRLDLFDEDEIQTVCERISIKTTRGKETPQPHAIPTFCEGNKNHF